MKRLLVLLLACSLTAADHPTKQFVKDGVARLVGKIIRLNPKDKKNPAGHEFYFMYSHPEKGEAAFPLIIELPALREMVQSDRSSEYILDAKVVEKEIYVGEQKKLISHLQATALRPINLAAVMPAPKGTVSQSTQWATPESRGDRPYIGTGPGGAGTSAQVPVKDVDDDVTNSIIFSGAALLLGGMLIRN